MLLFWNEFNNSNIKVELIFFCKLFYSDWLNYLYMIYAKIFSNVNFSIM